MPLILLEKFFALPRFVVYELILFVSHFARLQHKTPFRFDSTYYSTNSTHSPPPHLEIVQNTLCALAGAEAESVLVSPSSHPAPTGAHVASNRHRATPQFSFLHQPSLCKPRPLILKIYKRKFARSRPTYDKTTDSNNTCAKAKIPAEKCPEQDRQTNGQTPTLLQRHPTGKRNYKASRLTALAGLITLSCRRPHNPMAKKAHNVSTCDEWPLMMHRLLQQNVLQSIPLSSR
jgi:hypothetical protein